MKLTIPAYSQNFPWKEIIEASELYGVAWEMIASIIQTESSGNQFAYRYEPKFNYLHDLNLLQNAWKCPAETALIMQKSSYGYCQVMGATAIDLGLMKLPDFFTWPTLLYRTDINLKFACKLINQKAKKYGNDPSDLYASYNAGTVKKSPQGNYENQWAVTKFQKHYRDFIGNTTNQIMFDIKI